MDSKSRRRTRPRTATTEGTFRWRHEEAAAFLRVAILALLGGAILLNGCGSVQEHRMRQFPDHFAALAPPVQARVAEAMIARGDHPKTVYLALGTPVYVVPGTGIERVWVYWGSLPEADPPPSDTVRFHSRSELRMPGPTEQRRELRVHFQEERVARWTLGTIDLEAAASHPRLKMGTYPRWNQD